MKIIELSLEDIEAMKEGWGVVKLYAERGPPGILDNSILLHLPVLDQEIMKSDLKVETIVMEG